MKYTPLRTVVGLIEWVGCLGLVAGILLTGFGVMGSGFDRLLALAGLATVAVSMLFLALVGIASVLMDTEENTRRTADLIDAWMHPALPASTEAPAASSGAADGGTLTTQLCRRLWKRLWQSEK